jgi:acetylglutamate kinase
VTARGPQLLKLGGELLEDARRLRELAGAIARASIGRALTVVHGGGREIDAALRRAGIEKRQVEGLRVTDDATLDIVVEVLAGAVNTRFVAALCASGARAVGLTGADASLALVERAAAHRTVEGVDVDLGRVGRPSGGGAPQLLIDLAALGYVPVVTSLGMDADGALYNVNADTLAADLAARLGAARLVIAGGTPGVLDAAGRTVERLDGPAVDALIASRVANAGMVAKLRACQNALARGVREVVLMDGRDPAAVEAVLAAAPGAAPGPAATRMVA